jgi:hypothetical protein
MAMSVGGQCGDSIGADRVHRQAAAGVLDTKERGGRSRQSSRLARPGTFVPAVVTAGSTRWRARWVAIACTLMGAVLMLACPSGRGRAQGSATDVAYVEAVSGRAVASWQETTAELEILDPLNDGTRLDLETNAVLRLCHYQTHLLFTLKGPLRASISAAGVFAEDGTVVGAAAETCATPVISTFQAGFALRGLTNATLVALRPRIRIINRGAQSIQQAALWDLRRQTAVAKFSRAMVAPQLSDGQRYSLVVDFTNGAQLKAAFRASSATEASTVIVVLH